MTEPISQPWYLVGHHLEDSVECLHREAYGRWLVTTEGSKHVWNISPPEVLYERVPDPGHHPKPFDNETHVLTQVEAWPVVGKRFFLWFADPYSAIFHEHWRQSSRVQSIRRLVPDPEVELDPYDEQGFFG